MDTKDIVLTQEDCQHIFLFANGRSGSQRAQEYINLGTHSMTFTVERSSITINIFDLCSEEDRRQEDTYDRQGKNTQPDSVETVEDDGSRKGERSSLSPHQCRNDQRVEALSRHDVID